jgi:hypothetical protein
MRNKLLTGIAGLLLASSSMFAGWGVSVGINNGYYGPRGGVYVANRPAYGYSDGYVGNQGYVVVPPCRDEFVAPARYYGPERDRGYGDHGRRDDRRWDHNRRDDRHGDRGWRDDRHGRDSWRGR